MNIDEPKRENESALFNLGFRPFFLGAAGFAVIATLIWMGVYIFGGQLRPYGMPAITWHAHEMIYGYSLAVIAGFLLTAIKNWTGIQTLNGIPLLLLFLLWLAGRILPFFGDMVPLEFVAVVDLMFAALLVLSATLPIIKVKQWKNLGIISKLFLMFAGNCLFYLGVLGILDQGVYWGLYSGLYLILALIFTMGRRVIPFFIENGVGYPVQLKNRKWLDISSLVLFLIFFIADLIKPDGVIVALLAGILFVLHGVRLTGWYTHGIWKKPLLWVLYLAYGMIITGFALKAAIPIFKLSPYLPIHAFAFGGVGMMTIGMMSRVSLGHTGRSVSEPPVALFWVFTTLFIGGVVRVFVPLFDPSHYIVWIGISQGLWIISFAMFFYIYFPILTKKRLDGRYG